MSVAADIRAFVASARKELRIMRRYPTLLLSVLFWPILLPAAAVLMGRAYSGSNDPQAIHAFAQRAGTSEVTGFVFVGYAMYMWLSAMLWGPGSALRTEQLRGSRVAGDDLTPGHNATELPHEQLVFKCDVLVPNHPHFALTGWDAAGRQRLEAEPLADGARDRRLAASDVARDGDAHCRPGAARTRSKPRA